MPPLLGCIADDLTGATDLANTLVRGGMRTVQWIGVQGDAPLAAQADAVVIALKSRSIPASDAVDQSLSALRVLKAAGARRLLFKYCSTFDSTDQGNIGPVAEALMKELGVEQTIFCPAFPETGRTVYCGHLFVKGRLLNECGMQNHPLNPMNDPDLVRVLSRQATRPVGLLSRDAVHSGPEAIRQQLSELAGQDMSLIVTDALDETHLRNIARAVSAMPLITGGSGIAVGLPEAYRESGELSAQAAMPALPHIEGLTAVLSGSCSTATRCQVESFQQRHAAWSIDVRSAVQGAAIAEMALQWATSRLPQGPVLFFSTADPEQVRRIQQEFGVERTAAAIEQTMASIARGLLTLGVRRLIVAGGETSGAVLQTLGVQVLRIGPQIDPGVPWAESLGEPPLALALKSGNFGSEDFFQRALEMLP